MADAFDYRPDGRTIYLRLAGPESVVDAIAQEVRSFWEPDVADLPDPDDFWRSLGLLDCFGENKTVVKVPTTSTSFLELRKSLSQETPLHLSVAGGVVWIFADSDEQLAEVDKCLASLDLQGLVVQGSCKRFRVGTWPSSNMESAVKAAMDPTARFPGL